MRNPMDTCLSWRPCFTNCRKSIQATVFRKPNSTAITV